ncbi:MAG: hypothetical protein JWO68_4, partial [Actinomycetia bacterium]|nr:hypothetical protein [Actinomycetes bacterium]
MTDVLLVREAFRARERGAMPDPLAGIRI